MPLRPANVDEHAKRKIKNPNRSPRFIAVDLLMGRAERSAKFRRRIGCEAVAHDVLGDDSRDDELEEVIAASRLGPAAGHLESAKGMPADHGAGAGAIDVNVAGDQLRFYALDVSRTAREQ